MSANEHNVNYRIKKLEMRCVGVLWSIKFLNVSTYTLFVTLPVSNYILIHLLHLQNSTLRKFYFYDLSVYKLPNCICGVINPKQIANILMEECISIIVNPRTSISIMQMSEVVACMGDLIDHSLATGMSARSKLRC